MSNEEKNITFGLEIETSKTYSEIRKLELLLYRTLGLVRRLGLPEDIEQGIVRIQRLITTVRVAHAAFIALHTAAGPIGWALAGVGVVSAAWSVYDEIEYERTSHEW